MLHDEPRRPASKTAVLIATYRGRASSRPHAICHDPWASRLAGPEGEALGERLDPILPHMELWVAVRTAYLDAQVRYWTEPADDRAPARQVVILGSGLDTRAARLGRPGVVFFEVDHPASLEDRRSRLAAITGYPADAAIQVACDFEKDDFLDRLAAAGFRTDQPALLVWEGVTPYLREAAIRETLRRVASGCHERSILFFDHFGRAMARPDQRRPRDEETAAFVDGLGERIVFGTNDILPVLYEEGFRHVRSVSFDEACLSLTGTYERDRQFRFQRIVLCSRTPAHLP
ncbi:MAG: class I SAM-dependent methyltransferase [Deltaproteobacteria bacterium]|nr:class I SAM-dependent methyltransferase [Deltaproteobacteria bacterium]